MTGLLNALQTASGHVVVLGQGYVGLSVALAAASAGWQVTGIDTDPARVARLYDGRLVVPGVRADEFADGIDSGRITFTTSHDDLAQADVVLICVPTPVEERVPDLSMVVAAGEAVAEYLTAGTLVVLESTTYAGTTDGLLAPILERSGLVDGRDFLLAFAPERIDPGNTRFHFREVARVVGGTTPQATEAAVAFYSRLVDRVHPVSNARAAELSKLLENTYRMVNIALANEFAMMCADQGISPWEVIEAASTKPYGFMPFYPGPGVGGHCIPIDPVYLTWQSRRDVGRPVRLVELAQDINAEMPAYVTSRIAELLNVHKLAVNGANIVALGVTYKPDVGDMRESAPLQVLARLHHLGADLRYHDPYIPSIREGDLHLERSELADELLADADLVVVLTDHREYDLDHVAATARLVFDARNGTDDSHPNVVTL